ncbi:hypothetical protein [Microbulbifer sp. PAAF003]|uniref:hypothetical protein n=1 Tax=Microbulbifer sp. PAAF003 TaxID=3243375 RepID=UPI00403A2A8B
MRILLLFLIILLIGCSSQITYEDALRAAEVQEDQLGDGWYSKHPGFAECIAAKVQESEGLCRDSTAGERNEIMVIEFNENGRVINTFYEGKDQHLRCMEKETIDIVCPNPPLPNLFGILEVDVSYSE